MKRNRQREQFEAKLKAWEARNPTNPFLTEMASFGPNMLVDVYLVDQGGETIEAAAIALSSCFNDDADDVALALHDLKTDGQHVTGGGAMPVMIFKKART